MPQKHNSKAQNHTTPHKNFAPLSNNYYSIRNLRGLKRRKREGECWDGREGGYRPAQDLMVWILRRRTRTLAKWVMSPANLKIFMFVGSDLRRVDPDLCPATIGFRRRSAVRLKCVWPLHTSREDFRTWLGWESLLLLLPFSLFI